MNEKINQKRLERHFKEELNENYKKKGSFLGLYYLRYYIIKF